MAGWGLHVFMDSLMYFDIQPFTPIESNPLYSQGNTWLLYYVYEAIFYAGSATYLIYLARHLRRRGLIRSTRLVVGLVAVGLGVANLLTSILSLTLLATGSLLIDQGLSDLVPLHRKRFMPCSTFDYSHTITPCNNP